MKADFPHGKKGSALKGTLYVFVFPVQLPNPLLMFTLLSVPHI